MCNVPALLQLTLRVKQSCKIFCSNELGVPCCAMTRGLLPAFPRADAKRTVSACMPNGSNFARLWFLYSLRMNTFDIFFVMTSRGVAWSHHNVVTVSNKILICFVHSTLLRRASGCSVARKLRRRYFLLNTSRFID